MALYQLDDLIPHVPDSSWVADSAQVIGKVRLGEHCGIWYGAVLRGDGDAITLGDRSNVQENCVLHVDPGVPLVIGNGVTVGHKVMLHGCTIGDGSLIGIGAIVLNRVKIGRNCLVGAGALVTEGQEFPDGSLILGSPARLARPLSESQLALIKRSAESYVAHAARHRKGLARIA